MVDLDNVNQIKQKDPVNVLGSIELLSGQCKQSWEEVKSITIPSEYRNIKNIVFSGMGGSALGAYVIKDLFFKELKVPFEIINDYNLPPYVDESTLVILGSYSGTTEETLSCVQQVIRKKAKGFILTTGGELAKIAKRHNIPAYVFSPKNNPSGQPRLGTGYSVFGQIALLSMLNLLDISSDVVMETVNILREGNDLYGVNIHTSNNPAKKLANNFLGKIPIIVVAEHLIGAGRVIRNQLHESAKNFADYYPIPELNHHLMEGLKFPKQNPENLCFLLLISKSYSERILKRLEVTKDVVEKNALKVYIFTTGAKSRVAQAFQSIHFGAYANYYLGMLNGVDPSKIPWVDYFKKQLAK